MRWGEKGVGRVRKQENMKEGDGESFYICVVGFVRGREGEKNIRANINMRKCWNTSKYTANKNKITKKAKFEQHNY